MQRRSARRRSCVQTESPHESGPRALRPTLHAARAARFRPAAGSEPRPRTRVVRPRPKAPPRLSPAPREVPQPPLCASLRERCSIATLLRLRPPRAGICEIELRDPRVQRRDLECELLRALGRGRLQRERTQALSHLLLDVARALDLESDTRQLQLRAVPSALELPEPGGLLDERAPVLRLRRKNLLDLALPDDRVHRRAETDIGEDLDEIGAPHRRAVDEVLTLAAAHEPPGDRDLARSRDRARSPSSLSKTSSTSQCSAGFRSPPPAKRTSSGFSARSSEGVSDPAAQTIASAMFDLPEPFGPTMTATPGSSEISSESGNDLKPRMRSVRRCTEAAFSPRARTTQRTDPEALDSLGHDAERLERLACGFLLGGLLRRAAAPRRAARPRPPRHRRSGGRAAGPRPRARCSAPGFRSVRAPPGARSCSRRGSCARTRSARRTRRRSRARSARIRARGRRPQSRPRARRRGRSGSARCAGARPSGQSRRSRGAARRARAPSQPPRSSAARRHAHGSSRGDPSEAALKRSNTARAIASSRTLSPRNSSRS